MLLVEKLSANVRDGAFERSLRIWLRLLAGKVGVPTAKTTPTRRQCMVPPSLHLMKAVLGCESVEDFEFHACKCGCHR